MIEKIRVWARGLKAEIAILAAAIQDERTPWYAKVLGAFVIAYAVSPIDLIPDFNRPSPSHRWRAATWPQPCAARRRPTFWAWR